ncbi:MAG TPA: ice-binding family protein, partial [Lutibacter sp.]|nr:ice-binding family protein [Lutibacter sp.]
DDTNNSSGPAAVSLGTSGNYVILAKASITNIPTSSIIGDMGISPAAASFITGFGLTAATGYATSPQISGRIYAADMVAPTSSNLTLAVDNMNTAYNDAAGRPKPDFIELGTGNIGGKVLIPGLYKWSSSVTVPSDVTLSGGPNDVWIFQIAGNLTTSANIKVKLAGGAQAKNIFWQVAGYAIFETNAHFEGIVMAKTNITFNKGASLNGRALAQASVILNSNTITKPQ